VFFPIIEAVHVMGLALSVGMIMLADLATLGLLDRNAPRRFELWTWAGFAIMFVTGAALFLSNVTRYIHNSGFVLKIALLAVALAWHISFHRKGTRAAAILSLVLWSSVVVSSRFIADLDA